MPLVVLHIFEDDENVLVLVPLVLLLGDKVFRCKLQHY